MGPVSLTFLADEVLGRYDALHNLQGKVVKVVAKVEPLWLIVVVLIKVNIHALQIFPVDLMQAGDRLRLYHIDLIEGLEGPT